MSDVRWDETADFVMIGSGGGALVAGLVVRANGKVPLVLEKTETLGGSTAMSGGVLWIPNNPLMTREGVPDSAEAAATYLDAVVGDVGPASSPERRQAYLSTGPEVVRFLEEQGMTFMRAEGWCDYYSDRPGGNERGRSIGVPLLDSADLGPLMARLRPGVKVPLTVMETRTITLAKRTVKGFLTAMRMFARIRKMRRLGRPILGLGAALQGRMLMTADQHGVPMRTGVDVVDLVEEGGRIVGVVVRDGETLRHIRARDGVLINAGGFSHNADMRRRYGPEGASIAWTNANPGDTGEMIEAAMQHGAAVALMDQAWWICVSLHPDGNKPMHLTDIAKPHCIVVNRAGKRIMNESASYMENGQRILAQPEGVPVFAIFDGVHRSRYPWGSLPPGKVPQALIDAGYIVRADTLDALAGKLEIDAAGLRATVERFNAFAKTGRDEDFARGDRGYDRCVGDFTHRPNACLGSIAKAPFYAVRLYPGDVGTAGGLMTDADGRVLREDGSAIEGLYATGNSTASVMGKTYPGAGASIGASFIFGYRAARHAAWSARSNKQPDSAQLVEAPDRK